MNLGFKSLVIEYRKFSKKAVHMEMGIEDFAETKVCVAWHCKRKQAWKQSR